MGKFRFGKYAIEHYQGINVCCENIHWFAKRIIHVMALITMHAMNDLAHKASNET